MARLHRARAGGGLGGPPLFHQAGSRERAGDDGADIDAGTLAATASRLGMAVERRQRSEHCYNIPRPPSIAAAAERGITASISLAR